MKAKKKAKAVLLQVAHLGNLVVGKKAKNVGNIYDLQIRELIDNMIATCLEIDGVGIAAPQVYRSLRLFIIASRPNPRYPHAPKMRPLPVINPKIVSSGKKKSKDWEGCLSIPGIRGLVPRYSSITVEYTIKDGRRIKKTFKGFVARIFQHEYDHIEGMTFLERVENPKEFISEKEYQRMMKAKRIKQTEEAGISA